MIRACNCKHESQDKLHGKGKRVFNICGLNSVQKTIRCTVCSKEYKLGHNKEIAY